jgi:hypothetical protein
MTPSLTETIYVDFITSLPTTGAAADADATPTCEVFEDATDTATVAPTVVKRSGKTGNYRIPVVCTAANGFEAGKSYNVVASATVGGVAAKAIVQTFQIRTSDTDDLMLAGPVTVGTNNDKTGYGLTPAYDAAKTAATQNSVDTVASYVDTEVLAIKSKTDQLTFTGGKVDANSTMTLAPTDLNAIADTLLKRDWNSVTGEAAYSALNAFRMLRNVWSTAGGTLTVKKEDGAATAWTRTLAVDPAAQPIVGAS